MRLFVFLSDGKAISNIYDDMPQGQLPVQQGYEGLQPDSWLDQHVYEEVPANLKSAAHSFDAAHPSEVPINEGFSQCQSKYVCTDKLCHF